MTIPCDDHSIYTHEQIVESQGGIIITRNGMQVDCYGEWEENSNVHITGDWANGSEMSEVWVGDGYPGDGMPKDWTEAVDHLTAWAKRNGHTIYELTAI